MTIARVMKTGAIIIMAYSPNLYCQTSRQPGINDNQNGRGIDRVARNERWHRQDLPESHKASSRSHDAGGDK
jgi:hypothetical protein